MYHTIRKELINSMIKVSSNQSSVITNMSVRNNGSTSSSQRLKGKVAIVTASTDG